MRENVKNKNKPKISKAASLMLADRKNEDFFFAL
jgi:hypothetical protein